MGSSDADAATTGGIERADKQGATEEAASEDWMQAALLPIYGTMGAASANIVAAIAGFVMLGLASRKAVRAQG